MWTLKHFRNDKDNKSFHVFQAVFERLVDIICDKMSESLDSDPTLNTNKGTRLDNAPNSNVNCNCWKKYLPKFDEKNTNQIFSFLQNKIT